MPDEVNVLGAVAVNRFNILYVCRTCSGEWEEQWSCTCDSTCPIRGTRNIQPMSWEDSEQPG